MIFTPNQGQITDSKNQIRKDILFKGNGKGMDVYLRKTGLSYVTSDIKKIKREFDFLSEDQRLKLKLPSKTSYHIVRADIDFENGNPDPEIQQEDQLDGYSNFYYPQCPNGITHVTSYNKIMMKNIYPQTDIVFSGSKKQGLEYDLVVNPGGNPENIKLKYAGVKNITLEGRILKIDLGMGSVSECIPSVYQVIDGQKVDVDAKYVLRKITTGEQGPESSIEQFFYVVSFELADYQKAYPLIIDPWLTYYGLTDTNAGISVAADSLGNGVFTGFTSSVTFPVKLGFQNSYGGGSPYNDAYVVKFEPNSKLMWATYYGGSNEDEGRGIATDSAGNIFITGFTASTDFPIGAAAGNTVYKKGVSGSGAEYAFLVKFSPFGSRLFATYFGGSAGDLGFYIATHSTLIYIYGMTYSTDSIASPGAFQGTLRGQYDTFLAQFSTTGGFNWGTYYGGATAGTYGEEFCGGVTCDPSGNIYIGGYADDSDFPVSGGAYKTSLGGSIQDDGFLVKFNSAGGRIWGTLYGGDDYESGNGVVVDHLGFVYLIGETSSSSPANCIATAGAYQTALVTNGGGGGDNSYIVKFNGSGARIWGTYIGGTTRTWLTSIAADKRNNIYVYGEWEDDPAGSYGSHIGSCAYQPAFGGKEDQFIAKYDSGGTQKCMTYLGGPKEDDLDVAIYNSWLESNCIAVTNNYIYVTGCTHGDYPVTPGAFQTVQGDTTDIDAFMDQLCINLCEGNVLGLSFTSKTILACPGVSVVFTPSVNNSCDTSGYQFQWTFTGGTPASSSSINPTVTYPSAGTYSVKLVLTTSCKKDSLFQSTKVGLVLAASDSSVVCKGDKTGSAAVAASGGSGPYTYTWNNGSKDSAVSNLAAGIYSVTVIDSHGCTFSLADTISTLSGPLTASFSSSPSENAYQNSPVQFTQTSIGASKWVWNFGDSIKGQDTTSKLNPMHTFSDLNYYCVLLTVENKLKCVDTVSHCITVNLELKDSIFVPNVFSPNGDHVNDQFRIYTRGIQNLSYEIYDRWGLLIFQSSVIGTAWDGKTKAGENAPDGTYFYIYKATSFSQKNYNGSGFVDLLGSGK